MDIRELNFVSNLESFTEERRVEGHPNRAKLLRVSDIKLNMTELSVLTDLSMVTLKRKLESVESTPGPLNSLLYPLKKAVHAVYVYGNDNLDELKINREREETRLASARAKKVELDNAEKEKKLIPIEDAESVYCDYVGKFKARLLVIPTKAAHLLTSTQSPGQIQSILTDLIHEALDELTAEPFTQTPEHIEETGNSQAQ